MGDKNKLRTILPLQVFKCPLCPFQSLEMETTMNHADVAHEGFSSSNDENEVYCPFEGCQAQFGDPKLLQDHIETKHPESVHIAQIKQEKMEKLEGNIIEQDMTSIVIEDSDEECDQLREQLKDITDYEDITHSINEDVNLADRIQRMDRSQSKFQRGSKINEVSKKSKFSNESNYVCPFEKCNYQFESGNELQKHIHVQHPEPNQDNENTRNAKKVDLKLPSIHEETDVGYESSKILLIPMPNESASAVPTLDTQVQFNGAIVTFSFVLLHAELVTTKENMIELYSKKTTKKCGRPEAIKWLENKIPQAANWSRSTLGDRFIQAEQQALKFVGTKAMANKTGMGSLESIRNKKYLPDGVKVAKSPRNEMEKKMADMVKELQVVRNNIKEYDTRDMSKQIKRTNQDKNDDQSMKHFKANAFMESLKTKKSVTFSHQSDDDIDSLIADEEGASLPRMEEEKFLSMKRNRKDKVKEADDLRRSSVQDAYDNRFESVRDDDVDLKNMSGGWENLGHLASKMLEEDINGGSNKEQMQLMDSKLQNVEKTQESVQSEVKRSSERLNVIEENQEGQSKRLNTIETKQDGQTKKLDAILSFLKAQKEEKEKEDEDKKNNSENAN